MGAHFWPAPPAATSTGTPVSSPAVEGTLPVMADWTVNTAGSFDRADSAGGVIIRGTSVGTFHIEKRTRSGSNTTARFGLFVNPASAGQSSAVFVGWASSSSSKGYALGFGSAAARWDEYQVDLSLGTLSPTGNFLSFDLHGALRIETIVTSATALTFRAGDGYYYGQIYSSAYQAYVGVGKTLDTPIWGAIQGNPAFGSGKITARLWDYVEAA